jgi:hypothetical protein
VIPSAGLSPSKSRTSSFHAQFDSAGKRVNPMAWLNLNHVYAKNRGQYAVMLSDFLEAWEVFRTRSSPRLPFITVDGVCTYYHDEARANRAQAYYALLSGAAGFFNGNIRICWFMSPDTVPTAKRNWKDELVSAEELTATHTARFFRTLPWWKLLPDTSRRIFPHQDAICAAARTADGRTAVLYMPTRRTVATNLAVMPGERIHIRWFNPRSGDFHSSGTVTPAAREFAPPAGSNDAQEDWVLLLETEPRSGGSANMSSPRFQ